MTRISLATRNLKTLARDITTFGKPLVINPSPTDINQVIRDEVWLASPPGCITIRTDLDEDLPTAGLDARFAEAIKELLRNAMKALRRQGGRISIKTSLEEDCGKGRWLRIEVSDNGPGFPPGLRVFEAFVSSDPLSTGLGLVTVKELIEAHGGDVEAHNQPQGGASVVLLLPVAAGEG